MKKSLGVFALFTFVFLIASSVAAADLSRDETLNYIRNKLRESNVKGVSGVTWFPEYDQSNMNLVDWKWRMDRYSVRLTARAAGSRRSRNKDYYLYTLKIKFDLRNIRKAGGGNYWVKIYFENDIEWETKRYKVTGGRKQLRWTKRDEDHVLVIYLRNKRDGKRLAKAFNYYVKNWGASGSRNSGGRGRSRERDPFD